MRPYVCLGCGKRFTTLSKRGPLPKRCETCSSGEQEKFGEIPALKSLKQWDAEITPAEAIAQTRASIALRMRRDYCTWEQIAEECGYVDAAFAKRAVIHEFNIRQEKNGESVTMLRQQELERLEKLGRHALKVLETAHYLVNAGMIVTHEGPDGIRRPLYDDGPTLAAVKTLMQLSESRRKLLGLDAPQKVANEVTVKYTVQGIPESEMP